MYRLEKTICMSTLYQLKANTSRSCCFVSYGMVCNWLWIFTNYGLEKTICMSTFYQLRGMCIVPQPCLWPSDSEVDDDKCVKSILREFESLLHSQNQSFDRD
jgi:hypothetical protein